MITKLIADIRGIIVTSIVFFFSVWLISGMSINAVLQSPLLAAIEDANVYYHEDAYNYCSEKNRTYGDDNGTFEGCMIDRALNIEEYDENYVVPIVMALGFDRENSEDIVRIMYKQFADDTTYYGMG